MRSPSANVHKTWARDIARCPNCKAGGRMHPRWSGWVTPDKYRPGFLEHHEFQHERTVELGHTWVMEGVTYDD